MEWLLLIILGIFTGTLAGMMGIGGGVFVVPLLAYIFDVTGMPKEFIMKCSIGSSLAIMIFTSISSIWAHYKKENIVFDVFKKIVLWIVLGTVLGAFVAHLMTSQYLRIIFGLFMGLISIRMLKGFKFHEHKPRTLSNKILIIAGSLIGFKSGILGIGGGSLSVPFLAYFGFPMKKAIGTSATFTFPIALIGAISFFAFGFKAINYPHTIGYIYWPAFLSVAPLSVLFAPLGVKLSHIIPGRKLQIFFGLLLLVLSLKMLFYDTAISN